MIPEREIRWSLNKRRATYHQVVTPPVIRASAPIHGLDGRRFGAVVIDVDLSEIFDHIRQNAGEGSVYLVNEAGDYLIHPDRSREFGFEFAQPYRLRDDFPSLAAALSVDSDEARLVTDRAGDEFGVGPVSIHLAQGPLVTLILAWPHEVVFAPAIAVRNSSLLATGIAVLLAFALAILLARTYSGHPESDVLSSTYDGSSASETHHEMGSPTFVQSIHLAAFVSASTRSTISGASPT